MKGTFHAPPVGVQMVTSDDSRFNPARYEVHVPPAAAPPVPPPVAPAAPAAPGAPPAAPAVPPPITTVVITRPNPRFVLAERVYFILPRSAEPPSLAATGQWLVDYYVPAPAALAPAAPAPAAPAVPHGRPRSSLGKEPIPAAERDAHDAAMDAIVPPPDLEYAQMGRDFLLTGPNLWTVGELYLRPNLQKAERQDYEFAVRMQGLQNCNINAVWSTEDTGEEPADRSELMELFLQKFLTRFLAQAPMQQDTPDQIVQEAVQMHRQFCRGWALEHQRRLAPVIEASAEALIGLFYDRHLKPICPSDMTWLEVSRLLRRDARMGPHFGLCLHFYMVKLEQDRGARNASYKSMYNAGSSNMLALNSMDRLLMTEREHVRTLVLAAGDAEARRFSTACVDWFNIVSQLHRPVLQYSGAKRGRAARPDGNRSPWA